MTLYYHIIVILAIITLKGITMAPFHDNVIIILSPCNTVTVSRPPLNGNPGIHLIAKQMKSESAKHSETS